MTAQLTYSTKKNAEPIPASEGVKDRFRKEYKRQDKKEPFRLFVATPSKPKVHLFSIKEDAKDTFNEYRGTARILTDMKTGDIIDYSNGVLEKV